MAATTNAQQENVKHYDQVHTNGPVVEQTIRPNLPERTGMPLALSIQNPFPIHSFPIECPHLIWFLTLVFIGNSPSPEKSF